MADQTLVPKNRPYGERQALVDSMGQAGLPTSPPSPSPPGAVGVSPSQGQPRPAPQGQGPNMRFDPLALPPTAYSLGQGADGSGPGIATPQTTSAKAAFEQIAARSQSGIMRSIAMRKARQTP